MLELEKRSGIESNKVVQRLAEKTQVAFPKNGRIETVKNRLTHSYEVGTSALMMAESIGHNVDYKKSIYNVCLLHDIGHPPFGHEGSKVLNKKFKELGVSEGFSDNNNNFVMIQKNQILIDDYDLASIVKYPEKLYPYQKPSLQRILDNSIEEDIQYFEKSVKIYNRPTRTIACEIMDEADRNSYVCSDLADCYSLKWADAEEMAKLRDSNLFYDYEINEFLTLASSAIEAHNKSLIKKAFNGIKNKFNQNYYLGDDLSLKFKNEELYLLREELFKIEHKSFILSKEILEQREFNLAKLSAYVDYVLANEFYPSSTYKSRIEKQKDEKEKLRLIRDMIAESTDWYVINFSEK